MTDEVEPWQMSPAAEVKAVEVGLDAIELVLSMIPVMGGPMSGGMAIARGHRAQARTEELIQDVRDECTAALRHLAARSDRQGSTLVDVLALIEAEEERFVPLVNRVLTESMQTSNHEKLQNMRRGLGSLIGQPITDERDLFLQLVCRYDVLQAFILRILAGESNGTPTLVKDAPRIIWQSVQSEFRDYYQETQISSMTYALESDGLLVRDQEGLVLEDPDDPGRLYSNMNPTLGLKITDRGLRFLTYLDEGDERHEGENQ